LGLGYIFSGKWIVELLIDANFISWALLLAFLITLKLGFLFGFFVTWGIAVILGYWIWKKHLGSKRTNE
jgi:hypothetical protein